MNRYYCALIGNNMQINENIQRNGINLVGRKQQNEILWNILFGIIML